MKELAVKLQNCFGIEKLNHDFKFEKHKNVFTIYAKNGQMKTSFAKTFLKIQQDKQSEIKDSIFDDKSEIDIRIDKISIRPEDVFVIQSFESSYESDITSLLVNNDIKMKLADVLKTRDVFFSKLSELSGLKTKKVKNGKKIYEIEERIIADFGFTDNSVLMNLDALSYYGDKIDFSSVSYSSIFDPSVVKKIESTAFQAGIKKFIYASEKVYKSFLFLEKGCLTLPKLKNIASHLEKNSFFIKDNKIVLFGVDDSLDLESLKNKISDVQEIVKDMPEFQAIEKLLEDSKGIALKDIIETHLELIEYLSTDRLEELKKLLWFSYIKNNFSLFEELKTKYQNLSKSISQLNPNNTAWKRALDIFNKRFSVPFSMKIANLKGSIIGESVPNVVFSFTKGNRIKELSRSELEEVNTLSRGEARALYLLNIIFDLESFKLGQRKLIIVDDIADSFDYKNKYAIIEYLFELSHQNGLYMLILTHNFDFYRSVSSRLSVPRKNRLEVNISNNVICLKEEKYQNQPFKTWAESPGKKNMIALIPFVRNLVEYGKDYRAFDDKQPDFNILTSMLHQKEQTESLNFSHLQKIYKSYIDLGNSSNCEIDDDSIIHSLFEICDSLNEKDLDLENKIILAIAIRHKAEKYMIKKITEYNDMICVNDKPMSSIDFLNKLKNENNQTIRLINAYKQFGDEKIIDLMSSVNIMTPENIHLNSFMYEPLLDMDIVELLNLYNEISSL